MNGYGSEEIAEAQLCCSMSENHMTCLWRRSKQSLSYNANTLEECAGECWNQGCLVLHREAVSGERERLEESFWLACHQAWSQTRATHQLGLTVLVCNPSSQEAQVERSGVQGHLWRHSKLKFKAGLGSRTLSQTKTTVRHGQKQLYFPIKTGSQLTSQTVDGTTPTSRWIT